MEKHQTQIKEFLQLLYGEAEHREYMRGQEGTLDNKKYTVVYETGRMFRVILKLTHFDVEILDPKTSDFLNHTFIKKLEIIDKNSYSIDKLEAFLISKKKKLKSRDPIKFSINEENSIISVNEGQIISSLFDHEKAGSVIFTFKYSYIPNLELVINFFDTI